MLCAVGTAAAADTRDDLSRYSIAGRRSGYTYLSPETRAQQNDDFSNPGMLWVEQGERLWSAVPTDGNRNAKSCLQCHGDAANAMRGVAARYPAFDRGERRVVNIEQRINACRAKRQGELPFEYESKDLLAITAYVTRQSLNMPVSVKVTGAAARSFERGRTAYYQRRGQLDMACANCHEERTGSRLRAEVISQGQINGHPVYRQLWQTMGSAQRMFAWCNDAVRAEPYAFGSREYTDLELYVKWRGRGLPVEAPGIRR